MNICSEKEKELKNICSWKNKESDPHLQCKKWKVIEKNICSAKEIRNLEKKLHFWGIYLSLGKASKWEEKMMSY